MGGHEQFGEDLVLYALSVLEGEDLAKLQEHLASCGECRLELEHLRGDGALLALSTAGPKPPARARARLLNAIEKEARVHASRTEGAREMGHPRLRWAWLG